MIRVLMMMMIIVSTVFYNGVLSFLLIGIQVVKLTSSKNPLPFEYYHLPFCQPDKIERRAENLGMFWSVFELESG